MLEAPRPAPQPQGWGQVVLDESDYQWLPATVEVGGSYGVLVVWDVGIAMNALKTVWYPPYTTSLCIGVQCRTCKVHQLHQWAWGTSVTPSDVCVLRGGVYVYIANYEQVVDDKICHRR